MLYFSEVLFYVSPVVLFLRKSTIKAVNLLFEHICAVLLYVRPILNAVRVKQLAIISKGLLFQVKIAIIIKLIDAIRV